MGIVLSVAVGMPVTRLPLHKSVLALLTQTAPTSGIFIDLCQIDDQKSKEILFLTLTLWASVTYVLGHLIFK